VEAIIQLAIPAGIAILTFFGGRAFERNRIANQNRLKLLEPIEIWVDKSSRLVGIVSGDLSAISQGVPFQVGYSPQERIDTARVMAETKEKVLGILTSKALLTWSTRSLTTRLRDNLIKLDLLIEREYLQAHARLIDKMAARQDASSEMWSLLQISLVANVFIGDIHASLAELKTKFS
jgi:hypothetical protein